MPRSDPEYAAAWRTLAALTRDLETWVSERSIPFDDVANGGGSDASGTGGDGGSDDDGDGARGVSRSASLLLFSERRGCGVTALATAAAEAASHVPLVRLVTPRLVAGLSDERACTLLAEQFDDADRSPGSIIVLDDVELLLRYHRLTTTSAAAASGAGDDGGGGGGVSFSNPLLQMLRARLRAPPPGDHARLVVATCGDAEAARALGLVSGSGSGGGGGSGFFDVARRVPALSPDETSAALAHAGGEGIAPSIPAIVGLLHGTADGGGGVPLKPLLRALETAVHRAQGSGAISPEHFVDSARDQGLQGLQGLDLDSGAL